MKKINILCVIGLMNTGGVESVMMNYYERFDKTKFSITFLTSSNSKDIPYGWLDKNGIEIIVVDVFKNKIKTFFTFIEIFKRLNIDIIHSNVSNLFIFLAAFLCRVKVRVIHSHLFMENKYKTIKNKINIYTTNHLATTYIACGKAAGRDMFANKDFTYVKNAININKFIFNAKEKYEISKKLNLDGMIVFGCVARFEEQKNHKFLLQVFNCINHYIQNSHLLLVGDGILRQDLEKQAKELNLIQNISFVGNVVNPEIYYSAMDCFLLTSFFEGFPVVLVEAQTNGLKCFVSDKVSREVKILDSFEFVSLNYDSKFWAKKILFSYKTTKFKRYENSVEKIKQQGFDIDIESKRLQDLYLELIK
ncbi:putative CDP glycerol glycerophosphotransferase [Campylobacter sputorum subsp. bubulus]|uniref:Putative CDP glycerol glycerophosphotransferase n=1 Tax=Campylobacter sputorum subsp. sputorum TaxID=32024 RepID=A0A381DIR7_9BACT|nr:glycosyltransferase [Campylobacter sputorum]ASM35569.1 glycosyltransferase, family 1 [Campylobacter sputorum aubsp. sputorum RM3237]KAB0582700.1 glycosyltransferase family 1 protein [Campylobacter sputorum subsp. sputorum]QEL05760.1 glycosyltransferase, family 1 [Campylobacter sputorum subsp. sputorum]SUX08140.1 putative CDP glycerol glycerophosphotransferase [Campylobacter sputorum subsp. bubulus]SUX10535.1 putative CDP glycerol glycerophosphotransferase [Campylobacter sputorum subsp. sput